MKKRLLLITAVLFAINTPAVHASFITFSGLGAGGQFGFVHTEMEGPAFGFGLNGLADFDLGKFGHLHYAPSVTFWFKSDEWILGNDDRIEHLDGQVVMNLFDVKYVFPLDKYFIKPYVGISPLPAIVVNINKREVNGEKEWGRSDADAGFNVFAGIDFPIKNKFVPHIEWRFMASHDWAMRLTGGFVIRF